MSAATPEMGTTRSKVRRTSAMSAAVGALLSVFTAKSLYELIVPSRFVVPVTSGVRNGLVLRVLKLYRWYYRRPDRVNAYPNPRRYRGQIRPGAAQTSRKRCVPGRD